MGCQLRLGVEHRGVYIAAFAERSTMATGRAHRDGSRVGLPVARHSRRSGSTPSRQRSRAGPTVAGATDVRTRPLAAHPDLHRAVRLVLGRVSGSSTWVSRRSSPRASMSAPELTNEQAAETSTGRSSRSGSPSRGVSRRRGGRRPGRLGRSPREPSEPIREAHLRQRRFVAMPRTRSGRRWRRSGRRPKRRWPATRPVAELRGALAGIDVSAQRLSRLTNDLLILARTDERLIRRKPEMIDLSSWRPRRSRVCGGEPEATRPQWPSRRTCSSRRIPTTSGDRPDLVDNAVRYGQGSEDRPMRVATRHADGDAIVEVTDTGRASGAVDLERIFEPFFRVRADAGTPDGSGLGLAIARKPRRAKRRPIVGCEPGRRRFHVFDWCCPASGEVHVWRDNSGHHEYPRLAPHLRSLCQAMVATDRPAFVQRFASRAASSPFWSPRAVAQPRQRLLRGSPWSRHPRPAPSRQAGAPRRMRPLTRRRRRRIAGTRHGRRHDRGRRARHAVFLTYQQASLGFSIQYVEGWQVTTQPTESSSTTRTAARA